MIKKFIDKAKQRASTVIQNKNIGSLKLPPFEQLASKEFKCPTNDLWKYSMDQLCDLLKQYEQYVEEIKRCYEDICEDVQPVLKRYEIDKERKLLDEAVQKEEYIVELEKTLGEAQQQIEEEREEKEHLLHKLDFYVENKSPIEGICDKLEEEVTELHKQLGYLNEDNKHLIQQLAETQRGHRLEMDEKNKLILQLNSELTEFQQHIREYENRRNSYRQFENEEVNELQMEIGNKEREIDYLKERLTKQEIQYEQQLKEIQQKRELGIQEIKQLSEKLYGKLENQIGKPYSEQKVKQLRVGVMNKIFGMRKEFQITYKFYMQIASQVDDEKTMQKLIGLENRMNKMIIGLQDLIDEVEDLLS